MRILTEMIIEILKEEALPEPLLASGSGEGQDKIL